MPDTTNPPSPLLKMTSLLLKAFKWSSELADCQLQCLVAREMHTRGFVSPFFHPPTPEEAHVSKLSAVSHTHTATFQLKAFCAASGRSSMEGKRRADGSG